MKKILILGCLDNVSSHLADTLSKEGVEVWYVGNKNCDVLRARVSKFTVDDFNNPTKTMEILTSNYFDVVYHMAAFLQLCDTTTLTSEVVRNLQMFRTPPKVIFGSSISVYYPIADMTAKRVSRVVDEWSPLYFQERAMLTLPTASVVRICDYYGFACNYGDEPSIINSVFRQLFDAEPNSTIYIDQHEETSRQFVHLDDVIQNIKTCVTDPTEIIHIAHEDMFYIVLVIGYFNMLLEKNIKIQYSDIVGLNFKPAIHSPRKYKYHSAIELATGVRLAYEELCQQVPVVS